MTLDRTQYVGASEVGALFDLDPFIKTAQDLYLLKRGEQAGTKAGQAALLGQCVEGGLLEYFRLKLGAAMVTDKQRQKTRGFQLATIDAIVRVGSYKRRAFNQAILDAKMIGGFGDLPCHAEYGKAGTDQIPRHVRCQVQQQMDLFGLDTAFVGLLNKGAPKLYRVTADPDHQKRIAEAVEIFMKDYVLKGVKPLVGTPFRKEDIPWLKTA